MAWRHHLLGLTTVGLLASALWAQRDPPADEVLIRSADLPPDAVWLESLDLRLMSCDWQTPQAGKSVEGNPLKLHGVTYPHGVGSHARSEFNIDLKGAATRFLAMVGVDDEKQGQGSVVFRVWVDGKVVIETGTLRGGDEPKLISLDLTGAKRLGLVIDDADQSIDSDHGDWAGALIKLVAGTELRPVAIRGPVEPPVPVEPPIEMWSVTQTPPAPAIHGPRVTGATPGRPFLFRIPATGEAPLTFAAEGLPPGLRLDSATGVISGALAAEGTTDVMLTVRGPKGASSRKLTIIGGQHKLCQTPPLGWNSWNVFAGAIDEVKVRATAEAMVSSGLAAHGYVYVNIDDHWEAGRDAAGRIQTDPAKFPNMLALCDYVHSLGLKIGIYSSPGPTTCGGRTASWQHELLDAQQYAAWGFDYLKYDWCSYGDVVRDEPDGLPKLQKPYRVMREALDQVDRDIVFSFCQYGMGEVWKWGAELGGNCWRTTGDITDTWDSMSRIGFAQDGHEQYAGPGHWNDPDMLVVGKVGWGRPRANRMTPNEQVTHITLWVLQAAPLLLGCDLTQLDEFTLNLMCNDEVLDVHQDPLGKAAGRKARDGQQEIWARALSDGTLAVGLFNRGRDAADVTVKWADVGLAGEQPVRDLWARKDVGRHADGYTGRVPAHGARLIKVGAAR
ncbi:MAG: NPCBM/NEW2 domain-containing protein [Armatimonadetes bacterium]|nr:NPCBM/NEW2 domain-containing protein [Armatimonadota bacterium]